MLRFTALFFAMSLELSSALKTLNVGGLEIFTDQRRAVGGERCSGD